MARAVCFIWKILEMVNCDLWQEIASLKRQFAELLSDIGFIKEGLKARIIEQMSYKGTDGVMEATGPEVTHTNH